MTFTGTARILMLASLFFWNSWQIQYKHFLTTESLRHQIAGLRVKFRNCVPRISCMPAGRVCHELDSVQIALDMNPIHWFCDRIIHAPSFAAGMFGNVKTLLAASEPIPSTSPLTIRLSLIQVYLIKTVVCGKRHLAIKLDLECELVVLHFLLAIDTI